MSSRSLLVGLLLLATALPAGRAAEPVRGSVGLVPGESAEVTAELADGARLALAQVHDGGGPELTLRVGTKPGSWTGAARTGVKLASRSDTVALITPPDRSAAHALAQVGTRCHVPVISTSAAPTVTATGSTWVLAVVVRGSRKSPAEPRPPAFDAASEDAATRAFVRAFRARHQRDPTAWNAVGFDAARVVAEGVRRAGLRRSDLLRTVRRGEPVPGATGPLRFAASGNRLPSPAPVEPSRPSSAKKKAPEKPTEGGTAR